MISPKNPEYNTAGSEQPSGGKSRLDSPSSASSRKQTQSTFLVLRRFDVERAYRGDTPRSPRSKKWSDPKVSSVTQIEATPILEDERNNRTKFPPERPGAAKKVGTESFKGVNSWSRTAEHNSCPWKLEYRAPHRGEWALKSPQKSRNSQPSEQSMSDDLKPASTPYSSGAYSDITAKEPMATTSNRAHQGPSTERGRIDKPSQARVTESPPPPPGRSYL